MSQQTLTLSYKVNDDLTSERQREYKELVFDALAYYAINENATDAEKELINQMENGWEK